MSISTVKERIINIINEHLDTQEKIEDSTSFTNDLGADSLDQIELVMAAEEEFGCEITDETAEQMETVGDAVRIIEGLI